MDLLFKTSVLLKAMLLIVPVPFIVLAFFSHPVGDDFGESSKALELGYWNAQIYWYNNFSGRYFSLALRSLYPYIADFIGGYFKGYKFVSLFIFTTLFLAIFSLLKAIVKVSIPSTTLVYNKLVFWGALTLYTIYLVRVPSPLEGFYWLSGTLVHSFACILTLFLLSLLLQARQILSYRNPYTKLIYTLLCIILTVGIVGSNEINAVLITLIALTGTLVAVYSKHSSSKIWRIILIVAVIATAISFLAPGNSIRRPVVELTNVKGEAGFGLFALSKSSEVAQYLFYSLVKSIYIFVRSVGSWSVDPALLCASLLAIPIVIRLANSTDISRRIPAKRISIILIIVLWLFFVFLPIFLPIFAGGYIPLRALNSSYLIFLVGWFVSLFVFLVASATKNSSNIIVPKYILVAAQIVMVLSLIFVGNLKPGLKDLLLSAPIAHSQLNNRYELIRKKIANNERNIVVPALTKIPKFLLNEDPLCPDFKPGKAEYYNKCQAKFFGIESIMRTEH